MAANEAFSVLQTGITVGSMLLGLYIRDKLQRKHKKEDADTAAIDACHEQVDKIEAERDAYKDKWMEARMECIVISNDLREAKNKLESVERRLRGL